jgi:phosphohistidine phosphatase SixA
MRHPPRHLPLLALLPLLAIPLADAPVAAQDGSVVVYVVRHAERADDGAPASGAMVDPPLSQAGHARARELSDLLLSVGLTHVHSTDYLRTRMTALPVTEAAAVPIAAYDAGDLAALARRLLDTPGTHLVVGHSNTVPELVELLGGEPGTPIDPLEYDRIYVIHVLPGGATGSAVFRYGAPYAGDP